MADDPRKVLSFANALETLRKAASSATGRAPLPKPDTIPPDLAAAAPALLAALRRMIGRHDHEGLAWGEEITEARAAVARAIPKKP